MDIQAINWQNLTREDLDMAKKEKTLKTKFLLAAAQNNTIMTDYINAKIDNVQPDYKCRFCGDKDETISHLISKSNQLAQKEYKTGNSLVRKGIYWELCKKLNFDHTTKWYMHKLESVLKNVSCSRIDSQLSWDSNRSPNPGQKTRLSDNEQKRELTV